MIEREMEDLLWLCPGDLLHEPLKPLARQVSSGVGRADLEFEHADGYRLVVEVKHGVAPRGVGVQVRDYWAAAKVKNPVVAYEMMVVANVIPPERRLLLEGWTIEPREISELQFRKVAGRIGYVFKSEQPISQVGGHEGPSIQTPTRPPLNADETGKPAKNNPKEQMKKGLSEGKPVRKCMLILQYLAQNGDWCDMAAISVYMRQQMNERGTLYTDDTYADASNALEESSMIERRLKPKLSRRITPEGVAFLRQHGWPCDTQNRQ